MPLVSIATSTFGRPEYIKSITVPCLLNQTFQDFEFHLAGDFDSQEIQQDMERFFEGLNDRRFNYFNNTKPWYRDADPSQFQIGGSVWNIAGVPALNKAIEKCSGEYFFRLDDDDVWARDHISSYIEVFSRERSVDVLHSPGDFYLHDRHQHIFGQKLDQDAMLNGVNQMFHSTVAWRTKTVGFEKYSDDPILPADLQQWQKFVRLGHKFHFIDRVTVTYLQRCSLDFSKQFVR
jgi:glycosyltransferase involved in cell wall biosynthesis